MILPWQQEAWQTIWQANLQNRLPHALLFVGLEGMGKAVFANHLVRALLCLQPTLCEKKNCHSCQLVNKHLHPNVMWVSHEEQGVAIKIEQIRAVNEFTYHTALQGERRIVIIQPAEAMNINAANALLKTLEEPSPSTLFILISAQPSLLPATILSRTQRIFFSIKEQSLALDWLKLQLGDSYLNDSKKNLDYTLLLKLANGAPLKALQLVKNDVLSVRQKLFDTLSLLSSSSFDPLQAAVNFMDSDAKILLDFTLSMLIDIMHLQLVNGAKDLTNQDYFTVISQIAKQTILKRNAKLMQKLQALYQTLCAGISLNKQLVLENIFILWSESCS